MTSGVMEKGSFMTDDETTHDHTNEFIDEFGDDATPPKSHSTNCSQVYTACEKRDDNSV
jgi:hypothetical protein